MRITGLGVDLVSIPRMRTTIDRWHDRFVARVFTDDEIAYCRARRDPAPHFAARFAAKEAVGKALGSGVYFTWKEIEIRGRPKPGVHLTGGTAAWAEKVSAGAIELSMTHSQELAAAVCAVVDA